MTPAITTDGIVTALRALGVRAGATVLVHSSLRRIGQVHGGPDTVVDGLLRSVGPRGTIAVPTFTGGPQLGPNMPPSFDVQADIGWTGAIPEALRRRPEALRSRHPTHSVAAIGPRAGYLTWAHARSWTPCDDRSPFARLAALPDGYILLIGVDHESNTTFHHVEELAGVGYHLQPTPVAARITADGRSAVVDTVLHQYGTPRRFMALDDELTAAGLQTVGTVGQATARYVNAARLVAFAIARLAVDPWAFVPGGMAAAAPPQP